MKSIRWSLLATLLTFSAVGQNILTLEGAVLRARSTYSPQDLPMMKWVPEEDAYSYLKDGYQTLAIEQVDGLEVYPAISTSDINEALAEHQTKIGGAYVLNWLDSKTLYFQSGGKLFTYGLNGTLTLHQELVKGASNITIAPTSLNAAYTIDNNVVVSWEKDNVTEHATTLEDLNIVSGQAIARSEFGITNGLFWSPDGAAIAFYQKDERLVSDYPLLELASTPGSLREIKYPMAGQPSEYARVGVFHRGLTSPIYLDTDDLERDQYLTNLSWSPDGSIITLAIINRAQNHFDLVAFNAQTGARLGVLFSEDDEQWAEPEFPAYWISNDQFIWLSERDGFMNLYLYHSSGRLIRQLTKNQFVATGITGRTAKGGILFTATGSDPRENHLFSVDLRGRQKQLTTESGYHRTTVQENGRWFIDSYQNVNTPRVIQLASFKGQTRQTLLEASDPWKESNISAPELGSITGPDGSTLYTRMYKPFDFDPTMKYPVLVYVYGGPHAQMVTNSWNGGGPLWMNEFANRGYLVFTLDNRGSAHRGTDFEQQIHRQLGTLEMEDQLAGIEYLKSLNYVDGENMAVHGWSYGGFMTTSLMLRKPGTFKAGVAGGPVTDWKYYEAMYGERYMDRPEENIEGYALSRLHNHADKLTGNLLLIHCTIDDVVVMQHNLSLVQEFVSKGIQMDFFPYPMHPHNVRGKDRLHLMTKVLNYVDEALQE